MGRIYTSVFNNVAVTAAQDLFELVAPADSVVILHDIHIGQNTDVGDAAEELLRIELNSGYTTSGSGGSAGTAVPIDTGDAAFGGTLEINNTTLASAGTIVTHSVWIWNVRGTLDRIFTPETRLIVTPSRRVCVRLPSAPADSLTMSGSITFEEIGG